MLLKQFYSDPQPVPSPLSTCEVGNVVDMEWSGNYIYYYVRLHYTKQLGESFIKHRPLLREMLNKG